MLETIEDQARRYAHVRNELVSRMRKLELELDKVRATRIARIKEAVREAGAEQEKLRTLIQAAPEQFVSPRTITVDDVKIGYRKQKGQVTFADEAATIDRIRQQLPTAQAALLIKRTEKVHKPGVYDLTAADLKRLGITIDADSDEVVIKPIDGEIDKLVDALLKAYSNDE